MRLVQCHVENFGGLADYSCRFESGLTVLHAPNGFGKSTLAEFIRAMFYGLPRASKTLGKNLRKKYLPWQGGRFGGNLVFEHEGVQYRIERTFGEKPAADTFALYDLTTNKKSARFSPQIGLELFGLDSDSFERSTYLPQQRGELNSFSTDAIQAKLADLVEDTNDVNNYDKAVKALREKRSSLLAYRGAGGSVPHAQERISQLEQSLQQCRDAHTALAEQLDREQTGRQALEDLKQRHRQLLDQLRQASTAAGKAAIAGQYRRLQEKKKEARAQLDRLEAAWPGGIAPRQEITQALEAMAQAASCEPSPSLLQAHAEAERSLQADAARFQAGVPAEQEFAVCRQNCRQYEQCCDLAQTACLGTDEQTRLTELEQFFAAGTPDAQQMQTIRAHQAELTRCRAELAATPPAEQTPTRGKKSPALLLLLLAVAAVAAGALLLTKGGYAAGGILLGCGVACLLSAMYLRLRALMTLQQAAPKDGVRRQALEEQIARLDARLQTALSPYFGAQLPPDAAAVVESRAAQYRDLLEKRARVEAERQRHLERAQALESEISAFLARYGAHAPGDFSEQLAALQRAADRYVHNREAAAQYDAQLRAAASQLRTHRKTVDAFAEKYGLTLDDDGRGTVQNMAQAAARRQTLLESLAALEQEETSFYAENRQILDEPDPPQTFDLPQLQRRQRELEAEINARTHALTQLNQSIRTLRQTADQRPELEDALAACRAEFAEGREKAALLDQTIAFLQQAKERLTTSYLGAVEKSFSGYLRRLTGEAPEHVYLDAQLQVKMERFGQMRELGHFSAGQTDLILLCMRFALVDALFKRTKPFIILDDPFVNLDDENTGQALALLRELAGQYQILYLVCNQSRCA